MAALPDQPFLFLDTDTLILGDLGRVPFDFTRPSASMRREGTWPEPQLYKGGYAEIWGALYDRFGLDMASSLDPSQPQDYWQRYLYFNAGWFFHQSPKVFGEHFLSYARSIRDNIPPALAAQSLDPWLDQIALPLADWVQAGARRLAPGGWLTLICGADGLPEVLAAMGSKLGSASVLPLTPREGKPALRILLRARKTGRAAFRLLAPFVIHAGDAHDGEGEQRQRHPRG